MMRHPWKLATPFVFPLAMIISGCSGESVENAADKTADKIKEGGQAAHKAIDKAADKIHKIEDKAGEKIHDLKEKISDKMHGAEATADKAKAAVNDAAKEIEKPK